ncbi:MAG TPA: hypothetical protein VFG21_11765 [Xanthomonadaceae bacterium]|nr:hypothetical protein [Xanthomonadaceae bacterium]
MSNYAAWAPIAMLAALLAALPARAQQEAAAALLPVPQDEYYDRDPAAVMPQIIGADDRKARRNLEMILDYDPRNVEARVTHAFHLLERGMNRHAEQEFGLAINMARRGSVQERHAYWAHGWGLFRTGEYRRALERWRQAEVLHGGRPDWVPWTYALSLWMAGDRELAVDFWRAAVRSDAERWGSSKGLAREIQDWSPNQRLAAEALHAEWKRRLTGS